jgi:translocation and assembly module TamB
LPNVGPIRDIAVTLRFSGRTVNLQTATASIGGSAISAIGEGDLSGTDWLKGVAPPFKFNLLGTNVPLSRQPGSIIRSDLNLSVQKTNGGPALISGTARLRDSYYLSDLADLVPGRVSSPQGRPPYFSIEEPALADWGLAVHVTGERGLTVFSSLFKGQATPNLRLQGTLQQPLALGEVKIDSGIVKFPFANLAVQRGYITLTSEDPYRPHLMITAASRKFGYDVRMDVTGPADEPVIQFTSTPPLSSEQLLLMVTAGELPKGGYTLNPQQRAQTMALFLGKDLLSKLGFGDQAEERLSFSSGQDISETGKPTYSLEYKLTDRWSVVGEYDRFNALNAGLKWKIYSR